MPFDAHILTLYPDMFPLKRQVQIASDIAKKGVARLAGLEAPVMEDNEATVAELLQQLAASTGTFVPTTSLLLGVLDLREVGMKPLRGDGAKIIDERATAR